MEFARSKMTYHLLNQVPTRLIIGPNLRKLTILKEEAGEQGLPVLQLAPGVVLGQDNACAKFVVALWPLPC